MRRWTHDYPGTSDLPQGQEPRVRDNEGATHGTPSKDLERLGVSPGVDILLQERKVSNSLSKERRTKSL